MHACLREMRMSPICTKRKSTDHRTTRTMYQHCTTLHTGCRDPPPPAQCGRRQIPVETSNNVNIASSTRRCQPLNSVRLRMTCYIVQCLHRDCFTPPLCKRGGFPTIFVADFKTENKNAVRTYICIYQGICVYLWGMVKGRRGCTKNRT